MLRHGAKQLFYKVVDFFGWIKIPITTLATIYSILVTIDTNHILCGSHPAIAFLHWLIFEHKFALLITFLCILTFIAVLEKCAIGSYTKLKRELKVCVSRLFWQKTISDFSPNLKTLKI